MQTIARILAGIISLAAFTASAASIETAYTRYYKEGDIRPIGQYFGAKLWDQGYRSVIASQPQAPQGQYFILRLKEWKSAGIQTARMRLYATDSKEPRDRTWDLRGKSLNDWLYLGLTGEDWIGEDVRPLAWRIELLDGSGSSVAEWNSFLWEMPE